MVMYDVSIVFVRLKDFKSCRSMLVVTATTCMEPDISVYRFKQIEK